MIRIVAVADTHEHHHDVIIPDGDILIHAGDMTMLGERKRIKECFEWINALPHQHKIVIAGNHDLSLSPETPMYHDLKMKEFLDAYPAITYLCDTGTTVKVRDRTLNIWGSPYTVAFNDWVFQYAENERSWNDIPNDTDILVTHMPPHGILDTIDAISRGGDCFSGGCKYLRNRVLTVKPLVHVFGHLHDSGGQIQEKDGTTFVNAAIGYHDEWLEDENVKPTAICVDI